MGQDMGGVPATIHGSDGVQDEIPLRSIPEGAENTAAVLVGETTVSPAPSLPSSPVLSVSAVPEVVPAVVPAVVSAVPESEEAPTKGNKGKGKKGAFKPK